MKKYRLWVTGERMKNLVFHVDEKSIKKTMKYIDEKYNWRQINKYDCQDQALVETFFNENINKEIIIKKEVRIWITGKNLKENKTFYEHQKETFKTLKYINRKFEKWELMIVYLNDKEKIRYYNFENNKKFTDNKEKFLKDLKK